MTEQANPKLEKFESLFKASIWDTVFEAELAALFIASPWLAVWPLGPIVRGVAALISNRLYSQLKLVADLAAIKLVNASHERDYEKAKLAEKAIAAGYGIDSPQFRNARENAKRALSDFGRYRG